MSGATVVHGDCTLPAAYAAGVGADWGAVIDLSRQPGQVRDAVGALAAHSRVYVLVSSISVYADNWKTGQDKPADSGLA